MIRNICCVALLLVLTGCAESADEESEASAATATTPAAAPQAATPANSRNACEVLTPEELKEAAGIEGSGTPSVSGGADVCSWFSPSGNLVLQLFPSASSYDNARSAFEDLFETKASPLPGVGDKAYYLTGKLSNMDTGTLVAAKGNKSISVQMLAGDASRHKTQLSDLANLVLGKI